MQRANDAQPGWAATPSTARAAVLCRAADLLEEHQLEIEDWVVEEAGLPRYFAGALGAAEEFRQAAALASAPLGQVLPFGATSPRNPYRSEPLQRLGSNAKDAKSETNFRT